MSDDFQEKTLRDEFAMAALSCLKPDLAFVDHRSDDLATRISLAGLNKLVAKRAYAIADVMLEERDKC